MAKAVGFAGAIARDILCDDRLCLLLASRQEAWGKLKACGHWANTLLSVGARVRFDGDFFDLDPAGEPSLVIEALDEFGDLADAVAIGLHSDRVAPCCGAVWALGTNSIFPTVDEPIRIHRTVWDWMRAEGRGLFILDWDAARIWRVEVGARSFFAADAEHASQIYERFKTEDPEIFFPRAAFALQVAA